MASVMQSFNLGADGKIHLAGQKSVTVNKGDTVQFVLVNDSGMAILDWGLYFNNPFDIENSLRYSFGAQAAIPNIYSAEKRVSLDKPGCLVPMYNSYAVYVAVKDKDGQKVIYQRDPEVIVADGAVIR